MSGVGGRKTRSNKERVHHSGPSTDPPVASAPTTDPPVTSSPAASSPATSSQVSLTLAMAQRGKEREDSTSVARGGESSKKMDIPFIRNAISGNVVALDLLESMDENEVMVFEDKFKKMKFSELDLITKLYNFIFKRS